MSIADTIYYAKTTSPQTFSTTTLANVTDLNESVYTGMGYWFKFVFAYSVAVGSATPKIGMTFPTSTVFAAHFRFTRLASGSNGGDAQGDIVSSGVGVQPLFSPIDSTDLLCTVEGTIVPSTDGTLQLQFAESSFGAAPVTIKAYAALIVRRLF